MIEIFDKASTDDAQPYRDQGLQSDWRSGCAELISWVSVQKNFKTCVSEISINALKF